MTPQPNRANRPTRGNPRNRLTRPYKPNNRTNQKDALNDLNDPNDSSDMFKTQKHIFQSMTPEQKLKIALRLYYSARQLKAAGLRVQNPDWTKGEIQNKLREIFLYART